MASCFPTRSPRTEFDRSRVARKSTNRDFFYPRDTHRGRLAPCTRPQGSCIAAATIRELELSTQLALSYGNGIDPTLGQWRSHFYGLGHGGSV
jgi:hypothetical protein